jgi:hypothetical protein
MKSLHVLRGRSPLFFVNADVSLFHQQSSLLLNVECSIEEFPKTVAESNTNYGAFVTVNHGLIELYHDMKFSGPTYHYWAQSFENFNHKALDVVQISSRRYTEQLGTKILEGLRQGDVLKNCIAANPKLIEETNSDFFTKFINPHLRFAEKDVYEVVGAFPLSPTNPARVESVAIMSSFNHQHGRQFRYVGGIPEGLLKLEGESVEHGKSVKECRYFLSDFPDKFKVLQATFKSWFNKELPEDSTFVSYSSLVPYYYKASHHIVRANQIVFVSWESQVKSDASDTEYNHRCLVKIDSFFRIEVPAEETCYVFANAIPLSYVMSTCTGSNEPWRSPDSESLLLKLQPKVRY